MNYAKLAAGVIISAGMLIFLLSGTLSFLIYLFEQNPNDMSADYIYSYLQNNIIKNTLFWIGLILIFASYPILPKPAIWQTYNMLKSQVEFVTKEEVKSRIKKLGLFMLTSKIITILALVFLALFLFELGIGFYSIINYVFFQKTTETFDFLRFLFEIFPLNILLILVIIVWSLKILMNNLAWLMDWFLYKEKPANYKTSSIIHIALLYLSWIVLIIIFYILASFNKYI